MKMISKEEISILRDSGNGDLAYFIKQQKDSASIVHILEHLGRLPKDFDGKFLLDLVNHKNKDVKLWAVKTIGKIGDINHLPILEDIVLKESDTLIRREAASSIGRFRSEVCIPVLYKILEDPDPKVILQGIRGLLVFKKDTSVRKQLSLLKNHENETIRNTINKEFAEKSKVTDGYAHSHCFDYLKNVVVNGDTIKVMELLKHESIHLTFTSPPYYNARDYSIYNSYKAYLDFLKNVFLQVYRITKEGRFLIVNTSPVIIPRVSRAHSSQRYPIPFDLHTILVDMGWEFIDDIVWVKPDASVKNRVGGFMQHRKPLGYKPNSVSEYLMVYRKKTDKLLDWNMKQYSNEIIEKSKVLDAFEISNVWKIEPKFSKNHTAIFPEALCKRVIQYYSFVGDLVFDPFGGSGTLAKTAIKFDRHFFTTELDSEYFEFIRKSITSDVFSHIQPKFYSFSEFKKTII